MAVKINSLEIENVKRIKAVAVTPSENGLTVIGGGNGQGKTSVLDAITWALGGDRYRPSNPTRDGSVIPPNIKVTLSNGLVVERSGKNSALKVTDPDGKRSGQQLLNEMIDQLALDLPKFMGASNKEKASTLLAVIGLGPQVAELEQKEKELYERRLVTGRDADRKKKYADELPFYEGVPDTPVSASELIAQQQAILARNGENQRKRERVKEILFEKQRIFDEAQRLEAQIEDLQKRLDERKNAFERVSEDAETATRDAAALQDKSTAELEANIASIDALNIKIRSNLDKERAMEEANQFFAQYEELTKQIEGTRQEKINLLNGAELPLPGLSVEDGELTYNGAKWDCMSGSDQLKVATATVRAVNPRCGFVLMDKLEQMDLNTMKEFGDWLEQEGLQVIATRVSTGEECSIIIEDGYSVQPQTDTQPEKTWKAGVF